LRAQGGIALLAGGGRGPHFLIFQRPLSFIFNFLSGFFFEVKKQGERSLLGGEGAPAHYLMTP